MLDTILKIWPKEGNNMLYKQKVVLYCPYCGEEYGTIIRMVKKKPKDKTVYRVYSPCHGA